MGTGFSRVYPWFTVGILLPVPVMGNPRVYYILYTINNTYIYKIIFKLLSLPPRLLSSLLAVMVLLLPLPPVR